MACAVRRCAAARRRCGPRCGAARSVHARSRRRALGGRHAEEADRRRKDRTADRAVVRIKFPQHRQRHVRHAVAAGARVSRRRVPRLRRLDAGAVRAAQRRLWHGDSRPAILGGLSDQSIAGLVFRAREEARITALEARAIGVQVNFAPIADVNNNPRNPVINIRSYGEDPARVAALVGAYVGGAKDGGMIATIKHFPGHGDTDVDSHLGLPIVSYDRARLRDVELVPFRRGIEQGAEAVMAAHIELPALDPTPQTPATFSRPILHDLLRQELGFGGLVYTDSMSMDAVAKMVPPDEGAVRALAAGADQVLHSPDPIAAFNGIKRAIASGRLGQAQIDESVRRVLRAKASVGLHRTSAIDLEAVPSKVGGRAHDAVAEEAFTRAITLVKDDRRHVPLTAPRDAPILYLSVLDYPSGWQIAAPSRTFIPELKKRWPQVTSIEVSDHTPMSELDLVRAVAPRYAAVIASVFVRSTSGSGRLDLGAELVRLLKDLARITDRANVPLVTVFFGNPYTASFVPELPAMLLTYDFYDQAERAAVRAIAGEARLSGRLPITLSPQLRAGFGLDRGAKP
ncbi:MAG: hypothetical protein JF610_13825 [Acidobacteria bacterium]|nr:hypothetical protein [Acidobacteriota bacterium]